MAAWICVAAAATLAIARMIWTSAARESARGRARAANEQQNAEWAESPEPRDAGVATMLGRRLMARSLDIGLLGSLMVAPVIPADAVVEFSHRPSFNGWATIWACIAIFGYEVCCTAIVEQTVGKAIMSVAVQDVTGRRLSWWRAVVRSVLVMGGVFVVTGLTYLIPCFLRDDRAALHDLASGSRVRPVAPS